jgi:uncharacterized lipoprotein
MKNWKRLLILMLSFLMVFGLAACSKSDTVEKGKENTTNSTKDKGEKL